MYLMGHLHQPYSDKKLPNKVSAGVLYQGMSIESLFSVYFGLDYSEQQVKARNGSWEVGLDTAAIQHVRLYSSASRNQ